jgi:hypothetical protein
LTVSVASLLVPLALALIFAVFVRLTLRVLIVNVLLVCPVLIVTLPSEPESSGYQFLIVRAILSRSFRKCFVAIPPPAIVLTDD